MKTLLYGCSTLLAVLDKSSSPSLFKKEEKVRPEESYNGAGRSDTFVYACYDVVESIGPGEKLRVRS